MAADTPCRKLLVQPLSIGLSCRSRCFGALVGGLAGDGLDLPLDRGDRLLGGVGVDIDLPAALLPVPSYTEPEEVEALVDLNDPRLVVVQSQPDLRQSASTSARRSSASSRVPITNTTESSA